MRRVSFLALVVSLNLVTVGGQSAEPVVGKDALGDVLLEQPLAPGRMREILARLSTATLVPFGVEFEAEAPLGRREVRRPVTTTERETLTGMPLSRALDRLIQSRSDYRWIKADGMINVRPVAYLTHPADLLNLRADRVSSHGESLGRVLARLVNAVDATYPIGNGTVGSVLQDPGRDKELNAWLNRPTEVNLPPGRTLAELLNSAAKAHGDLSWNVSYTGDAPTLKFAKISVSSIQGPWTFTLAPAPRQ